MLTTQMVAVMQKLLSRLMFRLQGVVIYGRITGGGGLAAVHQLCFTLLDPK